MFPRLPRFLRLVLLVLTFSLSLIFLLRAGGYQRPDMIPVNRQLFIPPRLQAPVFRVPLASASRQTGPTTLTRPIQASLLKKAQNVTVSTGKNSVNPHNFRRLLNPEKACVRSDGSHAWLLVYVHSAPTNMKKRQSIRQTWGEKSLLRRYNATLVFVMGTVADAKLSQLVQMESDQYKDIVQEDFLDSYRNLTYKAIAALKWTANYCSKVGFILKTDDDILVNIHRVVKHLHSVVVPQYGSHRLILCNLWTRMKVIRDKKSKWYTPEQEFPHDFFPPYCSGSAYIFSGDMASMMFYVSLKTPFFWIDDYYITGALIKALGVSHRRLNQAYSINPNVAEGKFRNDTKHELFFFHLHKLRITYGLWKNMTLMDDPLSPARAGNAPPIDSVHRQAPAA